MEYTMATEDKDVGLFDAHRYVHAGRVFNSENIDPSDSGVASFHRYPS